MTEGQPKKQRSVYALSRPSRCYGCDRKLLVDEIVCLRNDKEDREVYCLKCEQLDGMKVLPPGDAKVTRLVKKYSPAVFVVMKWSELWKCYERKGLLVDAAALERAMAECQSSIAEKKTTRTNKRGS